MIIIPIILILLKYRRLNFGIEVVFDCVNITTQIEIP